MIAASTSYGPYGNTASPTISYDNRPWVIIRSTDRDTTTSATTTTGDVWRFPWKRESSGSNAEVIAVEPSLSRQERARLLHRLWMQEHIFAVQTLTRAGEWAIPRQPSTPRAVERRHAYVRPLHKKRVCGGSSRYRVLVN